MFTYRSAYLTPSGGSIFRCTTKDRGERRAKGVATPFNPPELMRDRKPDVLCAYLFAMVQLTRLSRRRRCRLFPCLSVLHQLWQNRWHAKNHQRFVNSTVGWLRECSDLSGQRSTQRQGNKRQRRSRLNRVNCTIANTYNQSTSGLLSCINSGGLKGVATPFARLSPLSFVVQRKMEPPEGVSKRECP